MKSATFAGAATAPACVWYMALLVLAAAAAAEIVADACFALLPPKQGSQLSRLRFISSVSAC
jgi:hypothetical protein